MPACCQSNPARRQFAAMLLTLALFAAFLTPRAAAAEKDSPPRLSADPAFKQLSSGLGRGVNLGNALEAPREGEWGVTLKAEYFTKIKQAGFDSVRIPVRWSNHAGHAAPYAIDAKFFARVDWAVGQALKNRLIPVLNMHHYEEIFQDPDGHRAPLPGPLAADFRALPVVSAGPGFRVAERAARQAESPTSGTPCLAKAIRDRAPHQSHPRDRCRPDRLEQHQRPRPSGTARKRSPPDRHGPLLQPLPLHAPGRRLGRAGVQSLARHPLERHARRAEGRSQGLGQGDRVGRRASPADCTWASSAATTRPTWSRGPAGRGSSPNRPWSGR